MQPLSLLSEDYVLNHYAAEFERYLADGDQEIFEMLTTWNARDHRRSETQLESGLLSQFFRKLWGYLGSGEGKTGEYTLSPKHPVPAAGAGGGTGTADLALGIFDTSVTVGVPQVVAEFKDIRSGLDAPQRRKGNSRSPVKQMFDYLRLSNDVIDHRSPVRPTWGIVTDMNEFRLYLRTLGESQCQRFVIRKMTGDSGPSLLDEGEAGAAQRFLFSLMFHRNMLVSSSGKSVLEQLLEQQWIREKDLEESFYRDYSKFRGRMYAALTASNPDLRKVVVLRLTQRLIDRFIFLLFCEDMGERLRFPKDLVRDILVRASTDPYFDEHGDDLWNRIKRLFTAMERGGKFADKMVPEFNGGLFAADPNLDSLNIPNHVFCARGQGARADLVKSTDSNLLYLSACYNFGEKRTPRRRTIGLHTLGRIFEQSISDLEVMEALAEGKEPIQRMSKRKREGVYYTPEWITAYVVEETVGCKLEDFKRKIGLPDSSTITDDEVLAWRKARKTKQVNTAAGLYLKKLDEYTARVEALTVLDFACGSGAFLIQALRRLIQERRWISLERERIVQERWVFDYDNSIRETLSNNLYGLDINAESVEITRLALWLHTARPGKPLASLDHNIHAGNSLVDSRFAAFFARTPISLFDAESDDRRERINILDWRTTFPEVFERGGFDCVVGNPPYVKYQHLRKTDGSVAEYLREGTDGEGKRIFASTSSGNFDLYIPFIEKGFEFLNAEGRMGLIAPNLWIKQAYGEPLRQLVREGRRLERWMDFGDFQVFKDATTYTSLQFYTKNRASGVQYVQVRGKNLSGVAWGDDAGSAIPYTDLPTEGPWTFAAPETMRLIRRLSAQFPALADMVESISVGVQTSADKIYHLTEAAPGKYQTEAGTFTFEGYVRPLVSGADVQRYLTPSTDRRILFPYLRSGDEVALAPAAALEREAPTVWRYLTDHEAALRGRERGRFDDDGWYRFGRNQNIDKQHLPKVLVPRLVRHLDVTPDLKGDYVADNVDVGYLIPKRPADIWYLVGILNSAVADFVFRAISKPFRGGYWSANKQYVAPIPVPAAPLAQQKPVAQLARTLRTLGDAARDKSRQIDRRLESAGVRTVKDSPEWLWADMLPLEQRMSNAPVDLRTAGRKRKWAAAQLNEEVQTRVESWAAPLSHQPLDLRCESGEISVVNGDGVTVVNGIFVDDPAFVAIHWRRALAGRLVDARALFNVLSSRVATSNASLREQVVRLDAELTRLELEIQDKQAQLDRLVFELYELTEREVALVCDPLTRREIA